MSPFPPATCPLRIFVVENHRDTLAYLTLYLEQMGHTVHSAQSLREALAEIPKVECDVLISDVGLADGTGWDLLRRLRDDALPHPPFAIAMSGVGMNADRLKGASAGFRHHLLKPFDVEALDQMLAEAAEELRE